MTKIARALAGATDMFRRALPIRTHLMALVIAALVPALLFGAYAVHLVGNNEQVQYDQRLTQTTGALADDIDRAIDGMIITLRTLTTATSLQSGDLVEFHARAQRSLEGTPHGISVIDPSGQLLANTLVPFGTPLPMVADPDLQARVMQSGTPQVSNLFTGMLLRRTFLSVNVPALENGRIKYVLSMSFEPDYIHRILLGQHLPPGWVTDVSDAAGVVIARSALNEQFVNTRIPADLFKLRGEVAVFKARSLDGVPVMRAVSRLKRADWMAVATVPLSVAHAGSRASQLTFALVGLAALALSLAMASGLTKVLSGAVLDLSTIARRIGTGRQIDAKPSPVSEVQTVRSALIEAQRQRLAHEEELQVAAERVAITARVAGVASATVTYQGDGQPLISLSREFNRLLGLDDTVSHLNGPDVADLVHPHDLDRITAAFAATIAPDGDGKFEIEHRVSRPNGEVAWLSVRSTTFFDGDGAERKPSLTVIAARDITDRRRMVDDLRASEARYRAALAVGRIASWETNLVTRKRIWSPEGRALFGVSIPTDIGTVGGPDDEYRNALHPDDRHLVQRFHALAETQDEFAAEYRVRHADGLIFWVSGRGHVIERDSAAKPVRLISVVADITARKNAEEVIRTSEARFRLLADAIPNIAWTATPDGLLDWHNPRWTEYTGSSGSPSESNWGAPLHDDDRVRTKAAWRAAIKSGQVYEIEHRARGRDGVYRWFLSRAAPVRDNHGVVVKWVGSATNIDATKRSEAALARANAAADAAYDGLIGLTLDGTIDSWNAGAARLFGFTADDVIGHSIDVLALPGSEAEQVTALDAVRSGGTFGPVDVKRRHKTGRCVDVAISMTPVRDANGHIIAIAKVAHDISERLEADRRQHLMNRELVHRVKNSFAVLQSVMRATLRSTPDPKAFAETFSGRLNSMAKAQDMLTERNWEDAEFSRLVEQQLSAHGGLVGGPIHGAGPELILPLDYAVPLGLVLHELATNAAKYGALSTPTGRIDLTWSESSTAARRAMQIVWQETGGPIVSLPTQKGFGSTLIDNSIPNATVKREYLREGLYCLIEVELPHRSQDKFSDVM